MLRVALLALTLSLVLAASASAFSAHGSVKQVYATGLKANARVTLLSRAGRTLATQRADSLGGALFRNVKAGAGYRVRAGGGRSGALTVLSTRSAPPSTKVYDQT